MSKDQDWKQLEEKIKEFFNFDDAVLVPGSGNSKGEEDVIGKSIICQCKCTGNKNISILSQDLDRLIEAAKLAEKFPVFASQTPSSTVLSIPLLDENEVDLKYIFTILTQLSRLKRLSTMLESIPTLDSANIMKLNVEVEALNKSATITGQYIQNKVKKIMKDLDFKLMNAVTYNLFEDEKNATK